MQRVGLVGLVVFIVAGPRDLGARVDQILFSELTPSTASIVIANADGTGERALINSSSILDYNAGVVP